VANEQTLKTRARLQRALPLPEKRIKTKRPNPSLTNLRPQNRRA